MKHYNNNDGYSIVISLLMVGFLIVVTSGVFNLVLGELNDNRGRENYLKAFAAAEGAQELALLQIKENGYGYYGSGAISSDNPILAEDPDNIKRAKDPIISYDLNSKTSSYEGNITPLGYAIIPLFTLNDAGVPEFFTAGSDIIALENNGAGIDDIVWNMLSEGAGMSGVGGFNQSDESTLSELTDVTANYSVRNFLDGFNDKLNYLILFNQNSTVSLDYKLSSNREFTKPISDIQSSAQVGKYKQNLETSLDNTEFLNILRYSIYSGN